MFQSQLFTVSRVSSELSFRPLHSPRRAVSPDERATSRDNDILLYSPARRLAISPTKCHPRPRRATRSLRKCHTFVSKSLPTRVIPTDVVSHFSSSLRFSPGLFSNVVAYVPLKECRHDTPCVQVKREKEKMRARSVILNVCLRAGRTQPVDPCRALTWIIVTKRAKKVFIKFFWTLLALDERSKKTDRREIIL